MKLNQFDSVNVSHVYLEGQVPNRVPLYKYLGIHLDQSLSFKEHVAWLIITRYLVNSVCQVGYVIT